MDPTGRAILRSSRLSLMLIVLAASPLLARPDVSPATGGGAALDQEEWALLRPPPVVTIEVRRVVGLAVLLPACTLFLLYLFRPRPYVLTGVVTWLAASAMLLVLSLDSAEHVDDTVDSLVAGRLAVVAWAISAMLMGAGVWFSGAWFRADHVVPRYLSWLAVGLVVWGAFAVTFLPPVAALVPAFAMMCLWQAQGAMAYARAARRQRFVGSMLCSAGAFGFVAVNMSAAVTDGVSRAFTSVSYLNGVSASLLILGMHLLVFEDVIDELRTAAAELARGRDEMKAMAVTDPLTRCYNRRFFDEIANHELQQHQRYGVQLSLLYLDIDHFKAINDTRGHHTGDLVLQTLGTILRELTRHSDYVFRWGGDEFLVLLSADEAQAGVKAQQIRQAFIESVIVRGLPDGVDLSIGCVTVPKGTEHIEPLIEQADRAMYRRKRALAG